MSSSQNEITSLLSEKFYAWQCRIRQIAMREAEGRPSQGMCPRLISATGEVLSEQIITLIVPGYPEESTDFFKFQVQRSNDPKEVREKAMRLLQSTHYHGSQHFSDQLTALFSPDSTLATSLATIGSCMLEFSEYNQGYRLLCDVKLLEAGDEYHSATLWHNRVFNSQTPDTVMILSFIPDWTKSEELSTQ